MKLHFAMAKFTPLRIACFSGFVAGLLLFTAAVPYVQRHVIINTTPSMPGTLYVRTNKDPEPGDTVLVCPDARLAKLEKIMHFNARGIVRNQCGGDVIGFIKIYAAKGGDSVKADGIHELLINGTAFKGSAPNPSFTLPVFRHEGELQAGEALVLTHNRDSFDSRYYGLIKENMIKAVLKEIF